MTPRAFLVGLAGGSCSGKSTLARALVAGLEPRGCSVLSFDAYYRPLGHLPLAERHRCNFDHPDSLDAELFSEQLRQLGAGRAVSQPLYDFATHSRRAEVRNVEPAPIVLAEGILLLSFASIRSQLDFSVFLDVPEELRLQRRIVRDALERGRSEASVRRQFSESVAPMHAEWVQPSAGFADKIVSSIEETALVEEIARRAVLQFSRGDI